MVVGQQENRPFEKNWPMFFIKTINQILITTLTNLFSSIISSNTLKRGINHENNYKN